MKKLMFFLLMSGAINAQMVDENPLSPALEIYIHTSMSGTGSVPWYNTAFSATYNSENYQISNIYLSDSIFIPRNCSTNSYGYDYNYIASGNDWTHLDAGIYKIMIKYENGGVWFTPYFYFDYRDEDWNKGLPGYPSPDIILEFTDTNNDTFVMYPLNNPNNKSYIKSGALVTHWDIHDNTPPNQLDYVAEDSFILNIIWHVSGHPYLYWNQTTPQGTSYFVYRNIGGGRFNWNLISGPSNFLFFIDSEITQSGNDGRNIYYYIKTLQNKISNIESIFGEYAPFDKRKKISVKKIDGNSELKIVPNPFNSSARIICPFLSNEPLTINVWDITGKLVKAISKNEVLTDHTNLRISGLGSGIYYCQIIIDKQTYWKKFSVVR